MKRVIIYVVAVLFVIFGVMFLQDSKIKSKSAANCKELLESHIPATITAFDISKPYMKTSGGKASKVTYSFKSPEGFEGDGQLEVFWNSNGTEIRTYSNPVVVMSEPAFCPDNNITSANIECAGSYKKVVVSVIIPKQYSENELEVVSKYVVYDLGYLLTDWWISFYTQDMSLFGPNYALSTVKVSNGNIHADIKINPLTKLANECLDSIRQNEDPHEIVLNENVKSTRKSVPPETFRNAKRIIGHYQYLGGDSSQWVYLGSDGNYYMLTYGDGEYFGLDRLIKIRNNVFKYADDTGEIFKTEQDGLYCYFEGALGAVYNTIY